jgi:hypothetical protein
LFSVSLTVAALLLACAVAWAQSYYIPDHERTPGAINPEITRENIAQTVCVSGYTKKIRPHPRNLWPQPVAGRWSASVKDQLEGSVCRQVCRGDITLQDGQAIFLRPDWTREYAKYFGLE